MDSLKFITNILEQNKNVPFVDRILNRNNYPTLDLGSGNFATHKMAYSQVGDNFIAYPTVFFDKEKNSLYELPPAQAIRFALQKGDFIPFSREGEADFFTNNYKRVWNKK